MRVPPDQRTRPATRPDQPPAAHLTGMPPPTTRRRRPPTPPRLPHDPRYEIAASVPRSGGPGGDRAAVVELDGYRAWRLLVELGLAPTVGVPCGPCCRCYGVPLGQGCGS
jgi:hypothetical protein